MYGYIATVHYVIYPHLKSIADVQVSSEHFTCEGFAVLTRQNFACESAALRSSLQQP